MRGNRPVRRRRANAAGSIPAYAGEPAECARPRAPSKVYPRVCGGTVAAKQQPCGCAGLSPRMRGNLIGRRRRGRRVRSIPAYAGEPEGGVHSVAVGGVYPRVCGGTAKIAVHGSGQPGLSPRMRGNLDDEQPADIGIGSIPAYAGEPRLRARAVHRCGVYPRVCGGTGQRRRRSAPPGGLSPRMRGNPRLDCGCRRHQRSIPAYAGEPRARGIRGIRSAVYPRVCGGTRP